MANWQVAHFSLLGFLAGQASSLLLPCLVIRLDVDLFVEAFARLPDAGVVDLPTNVNNISAGFLRTRIKADKLRGTYRPAPNAAFSALFGFGCLSNGQALPLSAVFSAELLMRRKHAADARDVRFYVR